MKVSKLFTTFIFSINAAYSMVVVTVYQLGNNVVLEGSGSINTGALMHVSHDVRSLEDISGFVYPEVIFNAFRMQTREQWQGDISGPSIRETKTPGFYHHPDTFTGDYFGIAQHSTNNQANSILIPHNYVSGSFLSASYTFNNKTLSDFGLSSNEADLVWTWGEGSYADSFTLKVGQPVPEPSTYALLIGCLALSSAFLKRRFKS